MIDKDDYVYFILGVDKTNWDIIEDREAWITELNLWDADLDFDHSIFVRDYGDSENVCKEIISTLSQACGSKWFSLSKPGTCTLNDYKNVRNEYEFDLYVLCPLDPTVETLVFETFDQLMEFLE